MIDVASYLPDETTLPKLHMALVLGLLAATGLVGVMIGVGAFVAQYSEPAGIAVTLVGSGAIVIGYSLLFVLSAVHIETPVGREYRRLREERRQERNRQL